MKHLIAPQPTPQDIEHRLAQKDDYVRLATEVWGADLTPAQINEAWEAIAAEVRAHTPPTVFHVMKDFCDRLGSRR
jgi:hypothetical protein